MQCIRCIQSCLRACLPRCMTSCLETEHDEHAPLLGGPPAEGPPRSYFSAPPIPESKMDSKVRSASAPESAKVHAHFEAFERFCSLYPELNTYSKATPSHTVRFSNAVRANYKDWEADTEASIRLRPQNAELLRQTSKKIHDKFGSPYLGDNPCHETREQHYQKREEEFLKLIGIPEGTPILISGIINPIVGDRLLEMKMNKRSSTI